MCAVLVLPERGKCGDGDTLLRPSLQRSCIPGGTGEEPPGTETCHKLLVSILLLARGKPLKPATMDAQALPTPWVHHLSDVTFVSAPLHNSLKRAHRFLQTLQSTDSQAKQTTRQFVRCVVEVQRAACVQSYHTHRSQACTHTHTHTQAHTNTS